MQVAHSQHVPHATLQGNHHLRAEQEWTIETVTPASAHEIVTFTSEARHAMFPTMHTQLADDGVHWIQSGTFICARDVLSKKVVATIGFVPYNHRFADLNMDYRDVRTAEVVRLFVSPRYRRGGLGVRLFGELKERARVQGVERLYLHTHRFLDGMPGFWEKRGFGVVFVDPDEEWQTTHMAMLLDRMEDCHGRCVD